MSEAQSTVDKRAIVDSLINAWKNKDVEGVLALLCDDVEYHFLVGARPLIGKDWVQRFLDQLKEHMSDDNQWRILRSAETGDSLLVEGVDDYRSSDGVHIRYPYMGVFEFRDGLISRWRDYADPGLINDQREGKTLPEWLVPLVA